MRLSNTSAKVRDSLSFKPHCSINLTGKNYILNQPYESVAELVITCLLFLCPYMDLHSLANATSGPWGRNRESRGPEGTQIVLRLSCRWPWLESLDDVSKTRKYFSTNSDDALNRPCTYTHQALLQTLAHTGSAILAV